MNYASIMPYAVGRNLILTEGPRRFRHVFRKRRPGRVILCAYFKMAANRHTPVRGMHYKRIRGGGEISRFLFTNRSKIREVPGMF